MPNYYAALSRASALHRGRARLQSRLGALEAEGHQVYLPERDTPAPLPEIGRTTMVFHANLVALRDAEAVVAVCDGP